MSINIRLSIWYDAKPIFFGLLSREKRGGSEERCDEGKVIFNVFNVFNVFLTCLMKMKYYNLYNKLNCLSAITILLRQYTY